MDIESDDNVRLHGVPPYRVAILHGGPGGAGEVAPVARTLSEHRGVLEPLQTRDSIEGQVEELREVLEKYADPPIRLIGWSWGAWLAYLFAAHHPSMVDKLILVSSGPFEDKYVADIERMRMSRLSEEERVELASLSVQLSGADDADRDALLARFGALFEQADAYDPVSIDDEQPAVIQFDIFNRVWGEAAALRTSGELLRAGSSIRCEVVAIHGDHDPHPAAGVTEPLEPVIRHFRFVLLERCGHKPWIERTARGQFFQILDRELATSSRP